MRKRPCLLFACIFLTGIAFQRYGWKVLCFVPLFFLGQEFYFGVKSGVEFDDLRCSNKKVRLGKSFRRIAGRSILLLSAFFLGMSHMKSQENFRDAYMSKLEDDSDTVIWGEIRRIEKTDYGERLILTDCYVSLQEAAVPCNKVMVYASSDHFRVGQIYQIKGQLNMFQSARNEGNFDSALFYQSQKIDFSVYESESILLANKENVLRDVILAQKERMESVYKNSLKEDAAGFYIGMMLGDKSLLSEETKDLFAVGGISHILAISGLHMSMIGRGFYQQLRKRRIGFLAAGVMAGFVLLMYCYMVGSGTSAIRAVGMMLLYFLAQYIGRSYDMLNSLGALLIYLLWDNPFLIEYSGFQFSVAALIGVGFVGNILSSRCVNGNQQSVDNTKEDFRRRVFKRMIGDVKSGLWISVGINLATLPITAYCYYEVPLYSPIVNSIVLPMLNPIFVLALFGAFIGSVIPFVGRVMLIPCGWLFSFYEFVCEFVKGLPFGSVITGKPELEKIALYYVILVLGCLLLSLRAAKTVDEQNKKDFSFIRICFTLSKLALCIMCGIIILWPKSAQSEIIFLDVGQGDGIFISSVDGTTCFIDGGSSDVNQVGIYRILPFFKAHGVRKIDYWFVSHADTDHISGLLEIMDSGYEINYLVVSDKMPEDENQKLLLDKANEQKIDVIRMTVDDAIRSLNMQMKCLYPWNEAEDRNEQSMVLLLEFFDEDGASRWKAFFSGDISSEGEAEFVRKGVLEDVDLYKAAHHGSKYSNSAELLSSIQPEYCVISCGVNNSYGHPHEETLRRLENAGCEIQTTATGGQVIVEIPSK